MKDWQTRVVDERAQLSVKLTALAAFISRRDSIFDALTKEDKDLLRRQREIMSDYIDVLDTRIMGFK